MGVSTANPRSIESLNEAAVKSLLDSHIAFTDQPMILAVRFDVADVDVHLLEVLDGFPGGEDDELMSTDFGPSANLRIVGNLELLIGSPEQLLSAIDRKDAVVASLRQGVVVYQDGSPKAAKLRAALGL